MWPHLQIYARRLRLDSCSVRARQEESKRACHTDLWLATAIAFNSKLAVSSVQNSINAGEPCERVLIENGCRFGSSKNTGNRGVLVVTKHPSATPQCFRHVHVYIYTPHTTPKAGDGEQPVLGEPGRRFISPGLLFIEADPLIRGRDHS